MMNRYLRFVLLLVVIATLFIAVTIPATACPSCYGDARSSRFDGMNAAILTMIGITGTVFAGFGGFFISVRKRMRLIHNDGQDADTLNSSHGDNSTDKTL